MCVYIYIYIYIYNSLEIRIMGKTLQKRYLNLQGSAFVSKSYIKSTPWLLSLFFFQTSFNPYVNFYEPLVSHFSWCSYICGNGGFSWFFAGKRGIKRVWVIWEVKVGRGIEESIPHQIIGKASRYSLYDQWSNLWFDILHHARKVYET
jgi:hypothetical protein